MSKDLSTLVEEILRKHPETRNDNTLLIWAVHREQGIESNALYATVMLKIRAKELSSVESITRARRKIVELNPELDANEVVKAMRAQQEEMYKEYARR